MYLFSSPLRQLWSLCAYVIEWIICVCTRERGREKEKKKTSTRSRLHTEIIIIVRTERKQKKIGLNRWQKPLPFWFKIFRTMGFSFARAPCAPYIHTRVVWCIKWMTWCASEVKLIQSVLRVFYFDFLSLFVCDCVCFSLGFFAAERLLHSLIEMRGYTHTILIQHICYQRRTGEYAGKQATSNSPAESTDHSEQPKAVVNKWKPTQPYLEIFRKNFSLMNIDYTTIMNAFTNYYVCVCVSTICVCVWRAKNTSNCFCSFLFLRQI